MVCHQELMDQRPCREPHSQSWYHMPTRREMQMPQSQYSTARAQACQVLNQSLIPRGKGNSESHKREGKIGHVI